MTKFLPEVLFESGFTDLVSVIPPGAQLTPTSKIPQEQLGKIPGRKLANGLWSGYAWRDFEPSVDDVRQWAIDGANLGLKADRFPGIDIDVTDERLANIIEQVAVAKLGATVVRIGRHPKRLLMYRTDEPFGRMRLWIKNREHLVEILGVGQQYLVAGTHPNTGRPYEFRGRAAESLTLAELPSISRAQAEEFLTHLAEQLGRLGLTTEREGDGSAQRATPANQLMLRAPSVDLVWDAVRMVPNTNALFANRDDYLTMGYAIRAAVGEENEDEGEAIFTEWALRWEGNDRFPAGNDPEVVRADWRRMHGPFSVGWNWLSEQARPFGFDTTALDFDAVEAAPAAPGSEGAGPVQAPVYSEQWLADRVVHRRASELRFVPETGRFLVWRRNRWEPDAELLAEDIVKRELRLVADRLMRESGSAKDVKENQTLAMAIASAKKAANVRTLIQSDRAIAVSLNALDHDPWMLNTPAGLVDLRTGKLLGPDPDALATKSTSVPPDFGGAAPNWKRFLAEATGGDRELEAYLQRYAGYVLTGSTREQQVLFIYGRGGTGKSVFAGVLEGVLGDYARTAPMDTFTASSNDRHTTDIAMLAGARLVKASETTAGRRWDEARVKSMSGGETITARFMRQDNFIFMPQFKLLFLGNHRPEIRDIGDDMKRRMQIVPFDVQPAVVDRELPAKLREEYPAILAWMIEGCLLWQRDGLNPPEKVKVSTADYFEQEDAIGRWLEERCELDVNAKATTHELFASWIEFANQNNEYKGNVKRFSAALIARGFERWKEPVTRRMGFVGLKLVNRDALDAIT